MGAISDNLVPFFEAHTAVFGLLFCLVYLIVHSDVFLRQVLGRIDGAVEGNYTTTSGTLISMAIMVFTYMALVVIVSAVY